MLTLALASLRQQARRYVAPVLAVVMGVAFVAASMTLTASLKASAKAALTGDLSHYAAVVLPGESGPVPESAVAKLRQLPGVSDVVVHRSTFIELSLPSGPRPMLVSTPPSPTSAARVVDGRMAAHAGEIVLSQSAASGSGLAVGDKVSLDNVGAPKDSGSAKRAPTLTVVGIVDAAADPRYGSGALAFATSGDIAAWSGATGYDEVDVAGQPGARADHVLSEVTDAVGGSAFVRTGDERAEKLLADATGGTDMLGILLLSFAAVALFVSALVIGNTFAILVARRRRDTALLRCVGATSRQVRRLALAESVVVGAAGALAGVALGIGLAAVLAQLANRTAALGLPHLTLTLDPTAMVVPALAGLVATVLAASLPVWRTGRVAPLEALRPALPAVGRSRASVLRLVLALLLVAGGTALLIGAPMALGESRLTLGLAVAMLGGVTSFVGVLMLASRYVPAVARLLGGVPGRLAGPPGELAVDNAVRNPGRAAATSAALLVGVTLIAMMLVGGQSASASAAKEIDSHYPVDVMVSGSAALPADAIRRVERVAGVSATAELPTAVADVTGTSGASGASGAPKTSGSSGAAASGAEEGVPLVGLPAVTAQVLRDQALLDAVPPGTLLVDRDVAEQTQRTTGERVTVKVGERHTTLVVRVGPRLPYPYMTTEVDLKRIAPQAKPTHVWLRLADGADVPRTVDAISAAASDVPGLVVAGSAPERAQINDALNIALSVVTALLGISVLIAVVGVGNTLSLSVLERTRESALLRAIGLTRGQLRLTVAVEALILAAVGAVVGCVLGIGYGWAGTLAMLPGRATVLAVPWGRLGLVVVVALVAGLLASVLPARRAARVAPAVALASE